MLVIRYFNEDLILRFLFNWLYILLLRLKKNEYVHLDVFIYVHYVYLEPCQIFMMECFPKIVRLLAKRSLLDDLQGSKNASDLCR